MLIYLTGTENQKKIENAIYEIQMEHTLAIGEPIKSNSINLLQEVKSTLCKNKDIDTLLIDLSVISNSDDDIIKAIKTLRHYNDNCRFIIVATELSVGNKLLEQLVNMGIYNIIIDEDEMISKISEYAVKNATYKEASIFLPREDEKEDEPKRAKFFKGRTEKLQNEAKKTGTKVILRPLKGKVIISLLGTQNRIGVTRTSISLAYTLMKEGNKVAVVEYNQNEDFQYLNNCYENQAYQNQVANFTKIYKIDFFENVSIETLTNIKGMNYDYIIIDNGNIYSNNLQEHLQEHNKADVKLIVFGSNAWEQQHLANVFQQLPEEVTENYRFITLCDEKMKEDIKEELEPNKVYFSTFNPEPFTEDEGILKCLEGFLYEEEITEKKGLFSIFK